MDLPVAEVRAIVERALAEDIAWGDMTSNTLIPSDSRAVGRVLAKSVGVLAGIEVLVLAFQSVDLSVQVEIRVPDGSPFQEGDVLARVEGPARSLLSAERTALNLVQRMTGIASATASYVEAVQGLPARIVDTRKTAPGLRILDKYAVRMGGGHNHRYNLADGILIKDNHLEMLAALGYSLKDVLERAHAQAPHMIKIEIEVDTLEQCREAVEAGADLILLDNMSVEQMREAVQFIGGRALTEASGGVGLETVRAIAETGVDLISVGKLTHSVQAADISLDFEGTGGNP
ncbi:MAG: carboxylating nicotinate-nucleotide diphosphorylase [Chloroflexota bacterium]|nr:MAG: carboxylating nicotinate-nucleotide diphosphorylase [Chloroflexota bacterium]